MIKLTKHEVKILVDSWENDSPVASIVADGLNDKGLVTYHSHNFHTSFHGIDVARLNARIHELEEAFEQACETMCLVDSCYGAEEERAVMGDNRRKLLG